MVFYHSSRTKWEKLNPNICLEILFHHNIPYQINTALIQQWTMLHDKLEKKSIASLIITHLEIFIIKLTKLNHEVLIGIDANEAFTSNSGDIARLCKTYQLIDPASTKHGSKGEHNTYARGLDRIDYNFLHTHHIQVHKKMRDSSIFINSYIRSFNTTRPSNPSEG